MEELFKQVSLEFLINEVRESGAIRSVPRTMRVIVALSRAKVGLSTKSKTIDKYVSDSDLATEALNDWAEMQGYITFNINGAWAAIKNHPDGYISTVISRMTASLTDFHVSIQGDAHDIELITAYLDENYSVTTTCIGLAKFSVKEQSVRIDETDIPNHSIRKAKDSFYPWMGVSLVEYFEAFMKSEEPVLLLYGPPGMGKSTFLRSLIHSGSYMTILAYDQNVIESPDLISKFHQTKAKILACEDADAHVRTREDGNYLMSSLLNASDGVILQPDRKIILSTNLETIDKIDPALLRVGRCFDILNFRRLTSNEAETIIVDMGHKLKDFSAKNEWTLAEVLSEENVARQTINRFKKGVGVGRR